ncbi:MAG: 30S ribosomal protein S12 methylthiotransferase RimO [Deltaproteobacteria bacterium]|nr:30S ribosomal protein S12 methylthiotransferase RimO [Deltaproteobacteria bacterium]
MNPSVHLVSLGCAKNTVDSEVMLGSLMKAHYSITLSPEEAEIIIINTCSFIKPAVEESIGTILEMALQKKSGTCTLLIVTGCLPERFGKTLSELLPEVDLFIGTGEFHRIAEIINLHRHGRSPSQFFMENRCYLYNHTTPRINTSPPGSAYIKIAEGCSHNCSFCIIPRLRGPFRSRPPDSIVQEALDLAHQGIKEINLIAQDTTMYGRDLSQPVTTATLLQRLARVENLEWIRLLYANPHNVTDDLVRTIQREEKICDYLDLPLQHVSRKILQAMRRKQDLKTITNLIESIRSMIPEVVIRTTVMVGFPGETEEIFQELVGFVCKTRFDHLGVFPYYREEGTRAASFPDQVPEKVKKHRRKIIMTTQATVSREKNSAKVGREQKVLIQGNSPSGGWGRTVSQAPEVDGITTVTADYDLVPGNMYNARITGAEVYDLYATILVPSSRS